MWIFGIISAMRKDKSQIPRDGLADVVRGFPSVRILVVGDLMLDRFQYGKVDRISPEAPVPVFNPAKTVEMPGGAGNTAVNLASLGCSVTLVARTGKDALSKRLLRLLGEERVKASFLRQEDCITPVKTRIIAGNNHILRIDEENVAPLDKSGLAHLGIAVEKEMDKTDIVVLSDYGKGCLSAELIAGIVKSAKAAKKPVIVDPKGADYGKYRGASLVKPNLKEFSEATGRRFDPRAGNFRKEMALAASALMKRTGIDAMLVTLGEYGMLYVPCGGSLEKSIHLPAQAREVFDVSGAGDTTAAALAAALGAGADMPRAMQIANAAAGVVVGKVGTASVSSSELTSALSRSCTSPVRKILSVRDLEREISDLRKLGRKIGFTNGCFDCCHLGHVASLREAKSLCDILVVGVNSDGWIRRHKGEGRPVQDEATRTALIASMEFVDYVVVFDEETALPTVRRLRPDVIAKEGYAMKDWPEGRFVKSIGGEAVTLGRVDGYSTTSIVERMKRSR